MACFTSSSIFPSSELISMNIKNAISTVWASDKNKFPLQVANISMAGHDSIYIPNRIFQHNALNLLPILDYCFHQYNLHS